MGNFQLMKKSSFYFIGMRWTGTYEAAVHGEIHSLIQLCKERLAELHLVGDEVDLIGLSYHDRPDGFTYYIGTETSEDQEIPSDMHRIIVPAHHFAVIEHNGQQAWRSYEQLYGWVQEQGYHLNQYGLNHIEVYPMNYDPYKMSPTLLIGVPIKKSPHMVD
ncbi:GyrI-like domain-containing protein [Jeotgalibacillus marinus]|uniref:GyrI-like domain-containing protein n=1 Tax=Jeotgalibacillus marinus TaxID=86667 RepID=A0ABV3Q0F6_9BACL